MSQSAAVSSQSAVEPAIATPSPVVAPKPFTGKTPARGTLVTRSPKGDYGMVQVAEELVLAHMYQRGRAIIDSGDLVVVSSPTKRLMPPVGTEIAVMAVADPLPSKLHSRTELWILAEELDAAQENLSKRYLCSANPRENLARIVHVNLDESWGKATTSTGEQTFVHPGNRLGVERKGLELIRVKAELAKVPVGIDVYFCGLSEATKEGGLRVLRGWIPCSELASAEAEVEAEKAAIEARRMATDKAREDRIEENRKFLETARMTQAEGSFTPVAVDEDFRKNRATIGYVSPQGWVKFIAPGGEFLFALESRRRGAFLNSADSMVVLSDRPAADAKLKQLTPGTEVLFLGLNPPAETGKARQVTSWIVATEIEKLDKSAIKAQRTLAERAAETAEAEKKRKELISSACQSTGKKQSGGGKKNKN